MERDAGASDTPREARVIASIIRSMGVDKYEAGVVHALMQLLHTHVGELLEEAQGVAEHAGRAELELDDLRLAAAAAAARVPAPPGPAAVLQLARERNALPLPLRVPDLPLPPVGEWLRVQRGPGVVIDEPPADPFAGMELKGPWAVAANADGGAAQEAVKRPGTAPS